MDFVGSLEVYYREIRVLNWIFLGGPCQVSISLNQSLQFGVSPPINWNLFSAVNFTDACK